MLMFLIDQLRQKENNCVFILVSAGQLVWRLLTLCSRRVREQFLRYVEVTHFMFQEGEGTVPEVGGGYSLSVPRR